MRIYHTEKILIVLLFLAVTSLSQTADDDEVDTSIPGYPYKIYSGFIILGIAARRKAIHYVFFPSQNDPSNEPLILWLSGAPGCSPLLACFHQNGPFIFQPGKSTFTLNQNSWNKKASVLYLELPVGTGFSEGYDEGTLTDQSFAVDAIYCLREFFNRFPSYKKNDLYLTGHGYGAVHAAYVAKQIIDQNNDPYTIFNDNFKLKGIMVGNPCVRPDECFSTGSSKYSEYHYEFLYKRGYFTKAVYNNYRGACLLNSDAYQCFVQRKKLDGYFNDTNSSLYNIYDKCYKSKNTSRQYINTGCEDNAGITTFLNDPSVKKNWNIQTSKEWAPCDDRVFKEYMGRNNSQWIFPILIKNKLKVWVYSGDVDSYVPIVGTKRWIEDLRHSLDMPVRRIWRQWWVPGRHKGEDQVGGFIWELRDITFVTVKNAGFRAPMDQPQAMSEVLAGFIAGKTLPYKNT